MERKEKGRLFLGGFVGEGPKFTKKTAQTTFSFRPPNPSINK